jgi:prolipoprotein diacylglyceryltransferase
MLNKKNLGLIIFFTLNFLYFFINRWIEKKYEIYVYSTFFLITLGIGAFVLYNLRKEDKINGTNNLIKSLISMVVIAFLLFVFYYFTKAEPLPLP